MSKKENKSSSLSSSNSRRASVNLGVSFITNFNPSQKSTPSRPRTTTFSSETIRKAFANGGSATPKSNKRSSVMGMSFSSPFKVFTTESPSTQTSSPKRKVASNKTALTPINMNTVASPASEGKPQILRLRKKRLALVEEDEQNSQSEIVRKVDLRDIINQYAPLSGEEWFGESPTKKQRSDSVSSESSEDSHQDSSEKALASQVKKLSLSTCGLIESVLAQLSQYQQGLLNSQLSVDVEIERESTVSQYNVLLSPPKTIGMFSSPETQHRRQQQETKLNLPCVLNELESNNNNNNKSTATKPLVRAEKSIRNISVLLPTSQLVENVSTNTQRATTTIVRKNMTLDEMTQQVLVVLKFLNSYGCGTNSSEMRSTSWSMFQTEEIVALTISEIAHALLRIKAESCRVCQDLNTQLERIQFFRQLVSAVQKYLEKDEVPTLAVAPRPELLISLAKDSNTLRPLIAKYADKQYTVLTSDQSIASSVKILNKLHMWKKKRIMLTMSKLKIFKDERATQPKHEIRLEDITSVEIVPSQKLHGAEYAFSIQAVIPNGENGHMKVKKWKIATNSRIEMTNWILAIDGLPSENFHSKMDISVKQSLLHAVYKNPYLGGMIKSDTEGEWHYYTDGTLVRVDIEKKGNKKTSTKSSNNSNSDNQSAEQPSMYYWNGETLVPNDDRSMLSGSMTSKNWKQLLASSLGFGRFNGVWLAWYSDTSKDPFVKYLWVPETNEFLNANSKLSFKWSNKQLQSKDGTCQWKTEGEVPTAVVMLLQCMRYFKLSK